MNTVITNKQARPDFQIGDILVSENKVFYILSSVDSASYCAVNLSSGGHWIGTHSTIADAICGLKLHSRNATITIS